MSYQVLARKWRPKSFESLVGQDHVVKALSNALDQNRLHHAYLFTGTRGVGKTTLSRILAKSLNCEAGISSHPCGHCAACLSIDKGSFIDYVEMDAASNRGVDDMTALLENAVYAPTHGRFKVYMLDEVHQLTGHAFNAMLKTLEEPPAHLKFILATTDPQKVPVTVLSRCLQFNLRQMAGTSIAEHLQFVLNEESIPFEAVALNLISRAASGSMRDALSLLDQAIAYGGNKVNEADVRAMLGAIDQSYLYEILQALVREDGKSLLDQAQSMEQRSISFSSALNDIANILHQVSLAQLVPNAIDDNIAEKPALLDLAAKLSAETIQLFYQIAILGRRDIGLAPDEYSGFTMTLMRMLAFMPTNKLEQATSAKSVEQTRISAPAIKPPPSSETRAPLQTPTQSIATPNISQSEEINVQEKQEESPAIEFDGNWRRLVDQLKLGLARTLAQNCELLSYTDDALELSVPESQKHLLEPGYQEKLRAAIQQYLNKKIRLNFQVGGTGNTPAMQISQEKAAIQSAAEAAIQEDDFVKSLVKDLGAQIVPSSIKPLE